MTLPSPLTKLLSYFSLPLSHVSWSFLALAQTFITPAPLYLSLNLFLLRMIPFSTWLVFGHPSVFLHMTIWQTICMLRIFLLCFIPQVFFLHVNSNWFVLSRNTPIICYMFSLFSDIFASVTVYCSLSLPTSWSPAVGFDFLGENIWKLISRNCSKLPWFMHFF